MHLKTKINYIQAPSSSLKACVQVELNRTNWESIKSKNGKRAFFQKLHQSVIPRIDRSQINTSKIKVFEKFDQDCEKVKINFIFG